MLKLYFRYTGLNIVLKLILPFSFYLFNVALKKFKITYMACIVAQIFLSNSTAMKYSKFYGSIKEIQHWIPKLNLLRL